VNFNVGLASLKDANGNTTTATYDANSRLRAHTTRAGDIIRYGYDTLNRLVTKTTAATPVACSATPTVTYSYDLAGRVTRVCDNTAAMPAIAAPPSATVYSMICVLTTGITRPYRVWVLLASVRVPRDHPQTQRNSDTMPATTKDQIKRFDRWRQRLPENTMYLTNAVLDELLPAFQDRGFDRFPDYADGSRLEVGPNCIPLQRRSGLEWPTVEVLFDKRNRPTLSVNFATLPEVCFRQTERGEEEISRIKANVTGGRAFFILCKGKGINFDCSFGYRGFALRPKSRLDAEVAILKSLLPWLFNALEAGIPGAWYNAQPGYVDKHAFLSRASRIFSVC